jgi:hypothetical protein
MGRPRITVGGDGLQLGWVSVNIFNKQSRRADKGWSSILGVGKELTTHHKKTACHMGSRTWWAVANTIMNLRVPWNVGNFLGSSVSVGFLRRTLLHGVIHSINCEEPYNINDTFQFSVRCPVKTAAAVTMLILVNRMIRTQPYTSTDFAVWKSFKDDRVLSSVVETLNTQTSHEAAVLYIQEIRPVIWGRVLSRQVLTQIGQKEYERYLGRVDRGNTAVETWAEFRTSHEY